MKKGQSISINTIIVAAIALLVLVIVAVIFMGRMGWFNKNDCFRFNPKDGCSYGRSCPSGYIQHPEAKCYTGSEVDPSNICCVPIGS